MQVSCRLLGVSELWSCVILKTARLVTAVARVEAQLIMAGAHKLEPLGMAAPGAQQQAVPWLHAQAG